MSGYRSGWFHESYRHALSARGIRTGRGYFAGKKKKRSWVFAPLFEKANAERDAEQKARVSDAGEQVDSSKGDVRKKAGEILAQGAGTLGTRSPREPRERFRTGELLSSDVEAFIKSRRSVNRAVDEANSGSVGSAVTMLSEGKNFEGQRLSATERELLQSSLNSFAVKQAQAGLEIPEVVQGTLDRSMRKRVSLLQAQAKRELEGPVKKELREDLTKAAVGAVESPIRAAEGLGELGRGAVGEAGGLLKNAGEVSSNPEEFPGMVGSIERLERTPMFDSVGDQSSTGGANVFIDDRGKFGDFGKPVSLNNLGPLVGGGNVNPVFQGGNNAFFGSGPTKKQDTYTDEVSRKVDSIHAARKKLAKVDLSAFNEGKRAFKKGDREKLIDSIGALQAEEAKLKDRWNLLGQTHAQVASVQNNESAYGADEGSNFLFGRGSGARRLADQTEKINDARRLVLKANNEAFSRRKMLEYDLQRMDSIVPPETSVPQSVKRFDEESSSRITDSFKDALKQSLLIRGGLDTNA